MVYDLIIIGAGPAGITASVYAARKRMNFLVIAGDIGGQTAWSGDIENYTGYQFISGLDLTAKFQEHMQKYGVGVKEDELAVELSRQNETIVLKTDKGRYETKTAIIASGKKSRELGVPGETELKNKGITYCATCDGPLFAGKAVAVIGGGNAGLEATIQLMKIADHIHLIESGAALNGDAILQEKVAGSNKVTVMTETQIKAVLGDKLVSGIKVETNGKEQELKLQGIFVEIGLIPNSDFAKEVEKNQDAEIIIDKHNRTSIPGIFAAGDVTDVPEKQIIIAAGEGAKASLSAFRYLIQKR